MMSPSPRTPKDVSDRALNMEEIRLVADLRAMHSKVSELHSIVECLKKRHVESDIGKHADYDLLTEDIRKAEEFYRWFVKVEEEKFGLLNSLVQLRFKIIHHFHRRHPDFKHTFQLVA